MYYKHFFLALFMGYTVVLSGMGDQNAFAKNTPPHELYYQGLLAYNRLYTQLMGLIQEKGAYNSVKQQLIIKGIVETLTALATPSGGKIPTDNGVSINMPPVLDAYTKKNLAQTLFEQALKKGDEEGVKFLHEAYSIDLNAATTRSRTAFDAIDQNPVLMLKLLIELGLDKKRIDTWNAEGQSVVHKASRQLVENHRGYEKPEDAFNEQLRQGIFTLPENTSKEDQLKYYQPVRKQGLEDKRDLLLEFKKLGAGDLPNKDGKKPSDILEVCAAQAGPCKQAYDAFVVSAAAQVQAAQK